MSDRSRKEIIIDIVPETVFWLTIVLLLIPLLLAGLL